LRLVICHAKNSAMTDGTTPVRDKLLLAQFRDALNEMYGERLERAVLYGSQARGEAGPESDYDVAVFLNGMNGSADRWVELDRLAALRVKFLDETGAFFDAKPYPAMAYRERSPLMHEIGRERTDL
jgi:predicted nucleotidyltransferase